MWQFHKFCREYWTINSKNLSNSTLQISMHLQSIFGTSASHSACQKAACDIFVSSLPFHFQLTSVQVTTLRLWPEPPPLPFRWYPYLYKSFFSPFLEQVLNMYKFLTGIHECYSSIYCWLVIEILDKWFTSQTHSSPLKGMSWIR